jgi:predicted RNA-binding protein with PIN domain
MLIIDGHNLIPKVPGLSLRDIDDEESLAALLQQYARKKRKKVVVFFDGAPPGQAGERVYGIVHAHFVPARLTADDAIRQYLAGMGKASRGATVVTSDRQVQANARELHARVLPSEDFARELTDLRSRQGEGETHTLEPSPAGSSGAVDEWLDLFGLDPARADQPIDLSKSLPQKTSAGKPQASPHRQPQPSPKKKSRTHHGFPRKSRT